MTQAFASLRESRLVTSHCEIPERGLFGAQLKLDSGEGRGVYEFLQIRDSVYMVTENVKYTGRSHEFLPGDGLISFHIQLTGSFSIAINHTSSLQIGAPTLLAWHQPRGVNASEWWMDGQVRSVTIYSHPEFIRSTLLAGQLSEAGHIQRILDEREGVIKYSQLPVTSELIAATESAISSPYKDRLRWLHMEAKVLDLYCLILSAFERLCDLSCEQYSKLDQSCLHRARQILSSRFRPIPTIQTVATEVGMSETKLKRGFKTLFNMTIFEYGHRCRMEHARRLLRDQHFPIGRVADAVGYSHQTSFAAAFKDHFGYRPKEIRNCDAARTRPKAVGLSRLG